jgi:putative tricarboxylic transport membrane protein
MSDGPPPAAGGLRGSVTTADSQSHYGGVALVVLALIALAISFWHPGPAGFFGPVLWPRVFALVIVLAGLGIAGGQIRVRNPQDFYGGVALIGLAIVAMLASIELPGMRGFAFGPGTAPRLFANLLAALGFVLALVGLFTDGPEGQRYTISGIVIVLGTFVGWFLLERVFRILLAGFFTERYALLYAQVLATLVLVALILTRIKVLERYGLRNSYTIIGSIFSFAIFIRPLGLVIASFLTILICACAATDIRWRETLIWAVILTTFCSLLFPYGLNLPFQLWPRF